MQQWNVGVYSKECRYISQCLFRFIEYCSKLVLAETFYFVEYPKTKQVDIDASLYTSSVPDMSLKSALSKIFSYVPSQRLAKEQLHKSSRNKPFICLYETFRLVGKTFVVWDTKLYKNFSIGSTAENYFRFAFYNEIHKNVTQQPGFFCIHIFKTNKVNDIQFRFLRACLMFWQNQVLCWASLMASIVFTSQMHPLIESIISFRMRFFCCSCCTSSLCSSNAARYDSPRFFSNSDFMSLSSFRGIKLSI